MMKNLPHGYENNLIWWPELGMGYHPKDPISYEGDYWQNYLKYDASDMGLKLTAARIMLVEKHTTKDDLVDIGIGGGLFVRSMDCFGYDVNAKANEWLMSVNKFKDPYTRPVRAITCWDTIEHIPDPLPLLNNVTEWVFTSLPIFDWAGKTVIQSKHYKPGEHIWYWSHDGFINYMGKNGFKMVDYNDHETQLGRHHILSYAFKRV